MLASAREYVAVIQRKKNCKEKEIRTSWIHLLHLFLFCHFWNMIRRSGRGVSHSLSLSLSLIPVFALFSLEKLFNELSSPFLLYLCSWTPLPHYTRGERERHTRKDRWSMKIVYKCFALWDTDLLFLLLLFFNLWRIFCGAFCFLLSITSSHSKKSETTTLQQQWYALSLSLSLSHFNSQKHITIITNQQQYDSTVWNVMQVQRRSRRGTRFARN